MKTANQLTFTTYEASLKLRPNDTTKLIFDKIDWAFIYGLVDSRYSPLGADGYDPISLFKAQLLIYLGEVSSDRKLTSALRYNGRLCLLCGFNFLKTPSNGTFSNFRARLGDDVFYEILHRLIAQAIALKVITGGDTAIDSTHLWAYSNSYGKKTCTCKGKCTCPKAYSDGDARWGAKKKDYVFFGYKVHLIVDASSQLPLDVTVTPGNEVDSPQAKPLLTGAKQKHPEVKLESASMDKAYDNYENYRFAVEDMKVTPIIALNSRGKVDALAKGSVYIAEDGSFTCFAGLKLVHWGQDKKRNRLKFRCPAALGRCHCLFGSACSPSPYGKIFYLYPSRNYRLIGPIPRGTDSWQEKYNARTSVERAYSEEKGSHRLADPRVRGLANVRIHVCLALCAQVIKRIAARVMETIGPPPRLPCPVPLSRD